jgi:hypothetical protein
VASTGLPRASPPTVVALASALHALALGPLAAPRPAFVAAVAARLLQPGPDGQVPPLTSAATASGLCALAASLGELATGRAVAPAPTAEAAPEGVQTLTEALLGAVAATAASLDAPDLAAAAGGAALLGVAPPAALWAALLRRCGDDPRGAPAVALAARRGLGPGLPSGIPAAVLEGYLSAALPSLSLLPASSVVGLLGLAAAAKGSLRSASATSLLGRVQAAAVAGSLSAADAALLVAALDGLALPLSAPLAASAAAAGGEAKGAAEGEAAGLSAAGVLRAAVAASLQPGAAVAALGPQPVAELLERLARLQQRLAAEVPASAAAQQAGGRGEPPLVSRAQLLGLASALQSWLASASAAELVPLASGVAAFGLAPSEAWLRALAEAATAGLRDADPLTAARLAVALTRLEQLVAAEAGAAAQAELVDWAAAFLSDAQVGREGCASSHCSGPAVPHSSEQVDRLTHASSPPRRSSSRPLRRRRSR